MTPRPVPMLPRPNQDLLNSLTAHLRPMRPVMGGCSEFVPVPDWCERSVGSVGLNAECSKDPKPLLDIAVFGEKASSMALAQRSELFHESRFVGSIFRVGSCFRDGLASLTLRFLALLARPFPGPLRYTLPPAFCHSQTGLTLIASGPLRPGAVSYSTDWPSVSEPVSLPTMLDT